MTTKAERSEAARALGAKSACKAGKARWANVSAESRSEHAREMSAAKWAKYRENKAKAVRWPRCRHSVERQQTECILCRWRGCDLCSLKHDCATSAKQEKTSGRLTPSAR